MASSVPLDHLRKLVPSVALSGSFFVSRKGMLQVSNFTEQAVGSGMFASVLQCPVGRGTLFTEVSQVVSCWRASSGDVSDSLSPTAVPGLSDSSSEPVGPKFTESEGKGPLDGITSDEFSVAGVYTGRQVCTGRTVHNIQCRRC